MRAIVGIAPKQPKFGTSPSRTLTLEQQNGYQNTINAIGVHTFGGASSSSGPPSYPRTPTMEDSEADEEPRTLMQHGKAQNDQEILNVQPTTMHPPLHRPGMPPTGPGWQTNTRESQMICRICYLPGHRGNRCRTDILANKERILAAYHSYPLDQRAELSNKALWIIQGLIPPSNTEKTGNTHNSSPNPDVQKN